MNPSRILPDLQCSLLCEDVRQEVSGNFILIGVISHLRVPQLPVTAFKLLLFNRWAAGDRRIQGDGAAYRAGPDHRAEASGDEVCLA